MNYIQSKIIYLLSLTCKINCQDEKLFILTNKKKGQKLKHNFEYQVENVKICQLQDFEIEKLRDWRNNQDNCKYLKKIPYITKEQQKQWYQNYLEDKNVMTFAIHETRDLIRMVGSLSLFNFCGDRAEIGRIMIGDKFAHGQGIGLKAMIATLLLCFKKFSLKLVYLHVYEENISALKTYKNVGFSIKASSHTKNGNDLLMTISKEEFIKKWENHYA